MNIQEIERILKRNGPRLAYQSLDGMNWKQFTSNDIRSNLDNISSYLSKNNIINKKILSLAGNCLESYILECSLINLGSSLSFTTRESLLDIQFNLDFDIIIVDYLNDIKENHILDNITKDKQIISIRNFKSSKESAGNYISLQNIYKIGLLSKRSLNKNEEKGEPIPVSQISFVQSNKLKSYTLNDLDTFIKKNESHFKALNENEFCTSLYLKKDIFSKVLNLFFLKFRNKFTNNVSLDSLMTNINELMPVNLIIDSENLKKIMNLCYMNKVNFSDLTGSKIKKIITYGLPSNENIELIKKENIMIINLLD
ncbi:hypothetical protein HN460_02105 [bacterium]|jgi:hypothetical protein|nr:hypothetical protein [bacterium]MBT3794973.1 hypothetical protein [bacterium]